MHKFMLNMITTGFLSISGTKVRNCAAYQEIQKNEKDWKRQSASFHLEFNFYNEITALTMSLKTIECITKSFFLVSLPKVHTKVNYLSNRFTLEQTRCVRVYQGVM